MRINIFCIVIMLMIAVVSCNEQSKKGGEESDSLITIKVPDDLLPTFCSESLLESIQVIRLETNKNCLISYPVKVLRHPSGNFYVLDYLKQIVIFSPEGAFIGKVGKQGNGPGEFIQASDFSFTPDGDVLVSDYHKVLRYEANGNFIGKVPLNLTDNAGYPIAAEQVALDGDGNIFLWNGSVRLTHENKGKLCAMYQFSPEGKVKNSYFPVNFRTANTPCRFLPLKSSFSINPIYGNDTIFCLKDNCVIPKYYIDFGENRLQESIPRNTLSLADFKAKTADKHAVIWRYIENEDWCFFRFAYNPPNGYCNFYHKGNSETFLVRSERNANIPSSLIKSIIGSWDEKFISVVQSYEISEAVNNGSNYEFLTGIKRCDNKAYRQLKLIREMDNPVLFLLSLRKPDPVRTSK